MKPELGSTCSKRKEPVGMNRRALFSEGGGNFVGYRTDGPYPSALTFIVTASASWHLSVMENARHFCAPA